MMTMDVSKTEPSTGGGGGGSQQNNPSSQLCAGCGKHIQDRYLLRALDLLWHEDCLKCGCCDCRLGEVGSTLYTKGNLILCKRDYLRLFGYTGQCAACNKVIPAFEMVMRARSNVYHLECFACQQCNHRFCVGDRFYLCENKILCEYDYEERLVFASMANHPMLKRHATNISQTQQQQQQVQQQQQQQQQGHNLMSLGPPSASSTGTPSNGMTLSVNGQRTNGDHNNNTGPSTPNSGPPSFGTPAHMKATLGTSS